MTACDFDILSQLLDLDTSSSYSTSLTTVTDLYHQTYIISCSAEPSPIKSRSERHSSTPHHHHISHIRSGSSAPEPTITYLGTIASSRLFRLVAFAIRSSSSAAIRSRAYTLDPALSHVRPLLSAQHHALIADRRVTAVTGSSLHRFPNLIASCRDALAPDGSRYGFNNSSRHECARRRTQRHHLAVLGLPDSPLHLPRRRVRLDHIQLQSAIGVSSVQRLRPC